MLPRSNLALALALLRVVAGDIGGTSLNFNYGWRFHYSEFDADKGPGTCSFPSTLTNYACEGLERNPNRFNHTDCRMACCYNPSCMAWQQDVPSNGTTSDRMCMHGYAGSGFHCAPVGYDIGKTGGLRHTPPVPPFLTNRSLGARALDDSAWEMVDLPHDYVSRNGTITQDADAHRGYFTRKHFALPSDWAPSKAGPSGEAGNQALFLRFEGAFHVAEVYVNGVFLQSHEDGYLPFTVRLDNCSNMEYGSGSHNVVAIRTDGSFGSGHWFEGGGLWRNVHLERRPLLYYLAPDAVFVKPQVAVDAGNKHLIDVQVQVEALTPSSSSASSAASAVTARFSLFDDSESPPALLAACNASSSPAALAATNPPVLLRCRLAVAQGLRLWSVQAAHLYRVLTEVGPSTSASSATWAPAAARNTTSGFRQANFDAVKGFSLNNNPFRLRGFSHHHSFAGAGAAADGIERLQLFKAQAGRALGGNAWRMSHNPYSEALGDILDALGLLTWAENRDYGAEYVSAMAALVRRDRSHPSVVLWSMCNEFECEQIEPNATAKAFRNAVLANDDSRPVTANNNGGHWTHVGQAGQIDVQGFSHVSASAIAKFQKLFPTVPTVLSECCSCDSQRLATAANPFDSSLAQDRRIATCQPQQNSPGLDGGTAGSLGVWTLFDYFGEPNPKNGWPKVSCSFGQFDIAGFPKPHAYWYSAVWGGVHGNSSAGTPGYVHRAPFVRILDLPDDLLLAPYAAPAHAPTAAPAPTPVCSFPRNVSGVQCHGLKVQPSALTAAACKAACCQLGPAQCSVWQWSSDKPPAQACWAGRFDPSNCDVAPGWQGQGLTGPSLCVVAAALSPPAAAAELLLNGASLGRMPVAPLDDGQNTASVAWQNVPCDANRVAPDSQLEARALDAGGKVLASHVLFGPDASAQLLLFVDVPSPSTGSGVALLLDGRDTALLRAQVSDAQGRLVSGAQAAASGRKQTGPTVTFRVLEGPGRVLGTGNGDATLHNQPSNASVPAFGGLARALVQASADCASVGLAILQGIDLEGGRTQLLPDPAKAPARLLVEASATLGGRTVRANATIALSCDAAVHSALAVARQYGGGAKQLDFSYLRSFHG